MESNAGSNAGSNAESGASGSLSASQSAASVAPGSALIRPRPRVGLLHIVLFSLVFAAGGAAIALADLLLVDATEITLGEPSPITVRVPSFAGYRSADTSLAFGGVLVERGERPDALTAASATEVMAARPHGLAGWGMLAIGLFLFCAFFSSALRSCHRGKLVRHQLVILGLLLVSMAAIKLATVLSAVSILAMPVATFALLARGAVDRASATATGLFAALAVGALVPFDPGVITVLAAQAVTPVLILGQVEHSRRRMIAASIAGGFAAVAAYFAYALLVWGSLPPLELAAIHNSGAFAALVGGVVSGPLAVLFLPPVQVLLGEVTANRLVDLENFSNPLLQQIAERSPGTWQHSLAMANMAETAANAVGANGRLVRTGAYYHDLGKSLQPKYFIENLTGGEPSPHDSLAPEVSADVIFAHVTEGVRVARKSGLPERIIDFMHMHHGDGRLEYFWTKCQESGNPSGLTEASFRYPGLRPQSKETAVLAIVDAVEAASRTLRNADDKNTRKLVQRIVYGKLHLGQLDESGLTMSDLRKISESLVTTIKHAHHGRIEYPWQREEAAAAAAEAAKDSSDKETRVVRSPAAKPVSSGRADPSRVDSGQSNTGRSDSGRIDTGRIQGDIRLDSLDGPRARWSRAAASETPERSLLDSSASLRPVVATPLSKPEPEPEPEPGVSRDPMDSASASVPDPAGDSASASASNPGAAESSSRMSASDSASLSASGLHSGARAAASSSSIRPTFEGPVPVTPDETTPMRVNRAEGASSASGSRNLPPAMVIEDSAPSVPRPAPDSIPIQPGDSAILLERDVEAAAEPEHVEPTEPPVEPTKPPVEPAEHEPKPPPAFANEAATLDPTDVEMTEPRAPTVRRNPRPSSSTSRLAEWEAALEKALPPSEKRRPGRETLGLLKAGEGATESVLEPPEPEPTLDPSAISLSPGTMVVGPPPETHPRDLLFGKANGTTKKGPNPGDETLEVRLPIPPESVRPSKRETAERDVVPPPEAFPDDTEPSVVSILKKDS